MNRIPKPPGPHGTLGPHGTPGPHGPWAMGPGPWALGHGPWAQAVLEASCGALRGSDAPTTLRAEPPGRSTPLSRAKPLGPPGRGRANPIFYTFTPCHTPPHLTSPHHASPRLVMTSHHARPGQSDRFGWIWHPKLGPKIHQNHQKIDIQVHSILDCHF